MPPGVPGGSIRRSRNVSEVDEGLKKRRRRGLSGEVMSENPDMSEIHRYLERDSDPYTEIHNEALKRYEEDTCTLFQWAIVENQHDIVLAFFQHLSLEKLRREKIYTQDDGSRYHRNRQSFTAIEFLVKNSHAKTLQLLVEKAPEKIEPFFKEIMHEVRGRGLSRVVNAMIDQKIYRTGKETVNILNELTYGQHRMYAPYVSRIVNTDPELLRVKDGSGRNFLHNLIRSNDRAALEILREIKPVILKYPEIINERDNNGRTPLALIVEDAVPFNSDFSYADQAIRVDKMDVLISMGANPTAEDKDGWTILDRLSQKGDDASPLMRLLVAHGGLYQKQFSTVFAQAAMPTAKAIQPNIPLVKARKVQKATQLNIAKK